MCHHDSHYASHGPAAGLVSGAAATAQAALQLASFPVDDPVCRDAAAGERAAVFPALPSCSAARRCGGGEDSAARKNNNNNMMGVCSGWREGKAINRNDKVEW